MPNLIQLFFAPFALSAIIAFAATPVVIKLAKRYGLVDDPAVHKHPKVIHTYPVPRGGGAAIFIAVLIASLIFLPLDKHLVGILVGAAIILVMGLLDDKYDLSPYPRLILQFVAASAPIAAGIGIAFITNPLTGNMIDLSTPQITFELLGRTRSIWILSDLFALLLIVTIMNGLNFGAKGVDGQLSGVVVIAATAIAILSLKFSADIAQWPVIVLAAITAGAFLGFLPWHIYPQKIMPSFGGSNLAGYLLGVLAILATAKAGTVLVVLALPLIDTGYVFIRRIASGRSPFWGDRGHLHHRLMDKARLSKSQVAIFYWVVTGVLAFIALNLNTGFKLYTMIGVGIAVGIFILWLTYRPEK